MSDTTLAQSVMLGEATRVMAQWIPRTGGDSRFGGTGIIEVFYTLVSVVLSNNCLTFFTKKKKQLPNLSKLKNLRQLELARARWLSKDESHQRPKRIVFFEEGGDKKLHVLGKVARCSSIHRVGDKLDVARSCRTQHSVYHVGEAIATFGIGG